MNTERSAITEPVRRVEVFTGAGRRRNWTGEEKVRIVAESATGEESVCAVARRHGLSPQQLFGWRRQAREAASRGNADRAPMFVPAVVESAMPVAPPATVSSPGNSRRRAPKTEGAGGIIEVELGGITIRVGRGADADTVAAVIAALKAPT
jgi:transposase